jgi:hypothetical protein
MRTVVSGFIGKESKPAKVMGLHVFRHNTLTQHMCSFIEHKPSAKRLSEDSEQNQPSNATRAQKQAAKATARTQNSRKQ